MIRTQPTEDGSFPYLRISFDRQKSIHGQQNTIHGRQDTIHARVAYDNREEIQLSPKKICESCEVHAVVSWSNVKEAKGRREHLTALSKGFGWSANCTVSEGSHYHFDDAVPGTGPQPLFSIRVLEHLDSAGNGVLITRSTHKLYNSCDGFYLTSQCMFTPSIMEYRIQVTSDHTTLTQFEALRHVGYVFTTRSCLLTWANGHRSSDAAMVYALGPLQPYLVWSSSCRFSDHSSCTALVSRKASPGQVQYPLHRHPQPTMVALPRRTFLA